MRRAYDPPVFEISPYEVALLVIGVGMLLSAWLPHRLFGKTATLAVVPMLIGAVMFWLYEPLLTPDPVRGTLGRLIWEKMSEAVVVISLVGAGLRINRRGWREWSLTCRLLVVTMPLTIAAAWALGMWAGLPVASALLAAAALAPTDPVLASDVQVEQPDEEEDDIRFALTSEAGINDGLAFPFTYLAVAVAAAGGLGEVDWLGWSLWELAGKLVIAGAVGVAVGWLMGAVIYRLPNGRSLARTDLGSLALCLFFVGYGLTELLQGYGFLAAFISAMVVRRADYDHEYNATLSEFISNLEHVLIAVLLVLLGGLAVRYLPMLDVLLALAGVAMVVLVRPAIALLSLAGHALGLLPKLVIAGFGVRGIGTVYYVAYGSGQASFDELGRVWALCLWVIVLSVILHGLSATAVMRWVHERQHGQAG